MHATRPQAASTISWNRKFSYFFLVPIVAFVIFSLITAVIVGAYRAEHQDRIFTGVTVWGVDLSGMTPAEAEAALTEAFTYTREDAITFTDPETGQTWTRTPADMGMIFDAGQTVAAAMATGRQGGPVTQLQALFQSWYYGRALPPVLVFDEGRLDAALGELAAEIDVASVNAAVDTSGDAVTYTPGQKGKRLDVADARQRLVAPLTDFRTAEMELLVHETEPQVYDDSAVANSIRQVTSTPVTFYLKEPLEDLDLGRIAVPPAELNGWLRVERVTQTDGTQEHQVFIDENAARAWLDQYARQIYREPVNARYYFDDPPRELVLVAPHVNGRELNVDATLAQLTSQLGTANHAVPFVIDEIVPLASNTATAAELGITELITETTTWFYGSSDERKHNIARAAANFYGIVIAPYEEFSFNKYLGTVSEADGYSVGLIIYGGQTIPGVGGGVCQVSTTIFQTAFWAGFPVRERWQHAYMVGYYNDGEGPGMDATVFSPLVDLRFVNNTPYHLLIENYYSEENEALTFKFYSTSMGRRVEKEGPFFENEIPAPGSEEDVWDFKEDLEPGTVEQFDWATIGARVTVDRTVYNAEGQVILDDVFVSNYIPWPSGYFYGPGVDAPDYSLIPPDEY